MTLNDEQVYDVINEVIATHDLSYGNQEIVEATSEYADFSIEAPNNATMYITVEFDDSDLESEESAKSRIIKEIKKAAYMFDADEEFYKLWSREFADQNGFTASQFLTMLQEDQDFFESI